MRDVGAVVGRGSEAGGSSIIERHYYFFIVIFFSYCSLLAKAGKQEPRAGSAPEADSTHLSGYLASTVVLADWRPDCAG